MGRRRRPVAPPGAKGANLNIVAAAIQLAGGPTKVARLCGITRQSVYAWIRDRRVERLIDGVRLARASGIPIEKLAGEDAFEAAESGGAKNRRRKKKRPQGVAE